jgi:SPOR domain
MTITAPPPDAVEPDTAPAQASAARCHRCGEPMAADQEWCLECGEGHTLVHSPPDWRIGVAIVVTVIVLALTGFAIALINLSDNASSSASARVATGASAAATTAASSAPATTFPGWAPGLAGYTAVLSSSTSQAGAESAAVRLRAVGIPVGILSSSAHPRMKARRWVVFNGHFPTLAAARLRAIQLRARGYDAHARLVG